MCDALTAAELMRRYMDRFPSEVHEHLGHYVYRLIDPRNGETFYVGRGQRDRVFQHARDELQLTIAREDGASEDTASAKLQQIRSVRAEGLEVMHVVHRHGLTEDQAIEVEGALIDAYPGLTNIQSGADNADRGVMPAKTIVEKYRAAEVDPSPNHNLLYIKVRRVTVEDKGLPLATRLAWRVSLEKAQRATFVLPVVDGLVRAAYRPVDWRDATPEHFPGLVAESMPGRRGFDIGGNCSDPEGDALYRGKRIPAHLQGSQGAANPVRYGYG
jgi:hypothetical protein